jgi:hypothetical protein
MKVVWKGDSYAVSLEVPHFYGRWMCVIVLDCIQSDLNTFHTFTLFLSNNRHNAALQSTVRYIRGPPFFFTIDLSWDVMQRRPVGHWFSCWLLTYLTLRTWGRRQLIYPKSGELLPTMLFHIQEENIVRSSSNIFFMITSVRTSNPTFSSWSLLWEPQIQHFLRDHFCEDLKSNILFMITYARSAGPTFSSWSLLWEPQIQHFLHDHFCENPESDISSWSLLSTSNPTFSSWPLMRERQIQHFLRGHFCENLKSNIFLMITSVRTSNPTFSS